MKKIIFILAFPIGILFYSTVPSDNYIIIQQDSLDGNNIKSFFYNTGIFDQDLRSSNHPGFEWPKGSGKFACFTAGLCCVGYVQNSLREFMCSYKGELAPGHIIYSGGIPMAVTDSRFKIYKVKRNYNDPEWLNWQNMTPFGAPFIDVNHNNIYEPFIDTPGVKGASQTIFACLTDGFPEEHKIGEGFGGGTPPMFAEIRITAWCYDIQGLQDVQFIKWQVINKNIYSWDSTFFAIVSDPDLGNPSDDFIGCDTVRKLGYCYNGDNNDEGFYSYGINPPAFGFRFIRSTKSNSGSYLGLTSFIAWHTHSIFCEYDPGSPLGAYNFLKGLKRDLTPWMIPPGGNPLLKTKYVYSGDPETGLGWNEGLPGTITGSVLNCGGPDSLSGPVWPVNYPADRKMAMNTGSKNLKINPGDTQIIVAAQLISRGNNNLNSVTKLKQLSDYVQHYYDSINVIGVNNISNEIPQQYKLYQNYPNPFNPTTKIRFSLPKFNSPLEGGKGGDKVVLKVYDVLGRVIVTLINEDLKPGLFEVEWNASGFSSGVYFYSLIINGGIIDTKKLVLLK